MERRAGGAKGTLARLGLAIAVGSFAACTTIPTSILLEVTGPAGKSLQVDQLRLDVYDSTGWVVRERPLPRIAVAQIALPTTIVIYPPTAGLLRFHARALYKGQAVAAAADSVLAYGNRQAPLHLVLATGSLADGDGDGVPDRIDNCPTWANPEQDACAGTDGRIPQVGDAGVDRGDTPSDSGQTSELAGFDQGPSVERTIPLDQGEPPADVGAEPRGEDANAFVDSRARDAGAVEADADNAPDGPACACPLGCRLAGECRQMVPSNGAQWPAIFSALGGPLSGTTVVDTRLCAIVGEKVQGFLLNGRYCVIALASLDLRGLLSVQGERPLILLLRDHLAMAAGAEIDLSAVGALPGPGGSAGGMPISERGPGLDGEGNGGGTLCACGSEQRGDYQRCGGGGGSYGTTGGRGGHEGQPCPRGVSAPGAAYGGASIEPLVGGSGGASGAGYAGALLRASRGGGGGGALQISCMGTIRIDGVISAGGGGGERGTPNFFDETGSGGGGGSGGAVLIEAPQVTGIGLVAANGGGGGAGGSTSCAAGAGDGADGLGSAQAASGGGGGGACGPRGGDGSSGAGGGKIGMNDTGSASNDFGAGGGGGGAGRVRFNVLEPTAGLPVATSAEGLLPGALKTQ